MKPSEIIIPKAKKTWLLLPNFKAITWRGTIYCRKQKDVDLLNETDTIDSAFKSHETIHIRQAQSMKDSWSRFFMNYIFNWIKNLPLIFVNVHAPYKLIPTEIEAYLYQDKLDYAKDVQPLNKWRIFQKLKLSQKRKIAKLYYKENNEKRSYSSLLYHIFISKDIIL